ncbi:MAG: ATP-binding protein [Planctomycetaceae bacterium]|jgi:AAA15 family ATPase/GTPase|nr:ATP-binding protein [Planctomycetaceae bacterium]
MEKWIKSISGKIPYTNKIVNINLDGKNLIVTGANGTGKTSFLKAVYKKVSLLIASKEFSALPQRTNQLNALENGLQIDIPDKINFSSMYKARKAVIQLFEEKRLSEIKQPTAAKAISVEEENARKQIDQKFANNLEQHLVNLKSRQALAITMNNDQILASSIESWFVDFENNLKILFEDEDIKLKFDPNRFHFSICQPNKPPYSFQTFSAGYRAIFDIYAELIMRAEYFKVMPKNLTGVVFIDEIDSHLHVSLQRLILPFFTEAFPRIQFIVTTHSPFVLMSTPDTVVFDLAQNEPITEDLSYYTYSAVMKGLWNVKPISVKLENTIKEIAEIVNSVQKDFLRLRELIDNVKGHENALDNESKAFYLLGLETLEDSGGSHV